MDSCYMCDAKATGKDHIPPRVFFPEQKDLGHLHGDLRKHLITVRACKQHNNACSEDDEYVAFIVTMSECNEEIGADHFATKVARSLSRKPMLRAMFEAHMRDVRLDGSLSAGLHIDRDRFAAMMDRIARGLYFDVTSAKLEGRLDLNCPGLHRLTETEVVRRSPPPLPTHAAPRWAGDRRVFEYVLGVDPFLLHMRFYGGFDVIVRRAATTP